MKNCIFYSIYGDDKGYYDLLKLSIKSLNKFFDKENIIVFSDRNIPELCNLCRKVFVVDYPTGYSVPMAHRLNLAKILLEEYDNVLHLDVDSIVTQPLEEIFELVEDNKISFGLDLPLKITDKYWSGPLLSEHEIEIYKDIDSFCCGVFLVNKSSSDLLQNIYNYIVEIENSNFFGICYDQHAFCTYLVRSNNYNYNLKNFVCNTVKHIEKNDISNKIKIYHFAGGVTSNEKYKSMENLYNTTVKIIDNRNNLLNIFPKNLKVAELGIFKGEFSEIILNELQPSKLFLVDTFPKEMCSGDKDGKNIVYVNLEEMYELIVDKFKIYENVKIIKSTTIDFLNSLNDNYLDLIYIDADHSYEAVKMDLKLSLKKIKTGGVIMGHDYTNDMFPGVVRAVNEFCFENNLKIDFLTEDGCPTYAIFKE